MSVKSRSMAELAVSKHQKYNPETRRKSYLRHKDRSIEYSVWYNRKKKFGISQEEYVFLLEKQEGVCAICRGNCSKSLAVDHNHETKNVRGLLCNRCNRGIGFLKDNVLFLQRAIDYIKKDGKW